MKCSKPTKRPSSTMGQTPNEAPRLAQVLKALLAPPGAVVALGVPVAIGLTYWTLVLGNSSGPLAYAAYCLSAYATVVACIYVALRNPIVKANELLHRSARLGRLIDNREQRASFSARATLLIDLLWAIANLAMGAAHESPWFATLAVYYLLLFAMRLILVQHVRCGECGGNVHGELQAHLACGILLVVSTCTLAGAVILVVHNKGGFAYAGNLIYAIAIYAFYTLAVGIANFIRFRTHRSPALAALWGINLASAFVSVFSLEVALVSAFGTSTDEASRFAMTVATGAVASFAVAALGAYMSLRSGRALAALNAQRPEAPDDAR